MATKKSKACTTALKAEQALSLKLRSAGASKDRHAAIVRLNKLRKKIESACPLPGMRLDGAIRYDQRGFRGPGDIATAADFRRWTAKAKTMTVAELEYSRRDALAAARAMAGHNPEREGRYMDEAMTYGDELRRRRDRR